MRTLTFFASLVLLVACGDDGRAMCDPACEADERCVGGVCLSGPADGGPRDVGRDARDGSVDDGSVDDADASVDVGRDSGPPVMCTAATEGDECGDPSLGDYTACVYAAPCDDAGERRRTITEMRCQAGSCLPMERMELDVSGCNRVQEGMVCAPPEVGAWSACSYTPTCSNTGARTRVTREHICRDSACAFRSTTETDMTTCSQDSNDMACTGCGGICRCFEESCQPLRLLTVRSTGGSSLRHTVRCPTNGNRCELEGTAMSGCSLFCPQGEEVEICCSNGSTPCGLSPAMPAPVSEVSYNASGLAIHDCSGGGPIMCSGTVTTNTTLTCTLTAIAK